MAQQDVGTCLICKHPLVSKLNIFKTRTNFSKTLVSSKLAKLVQTTFRQDAMSHAQDICSSCSALINQVDECEIKLMALENEVKLKYKMPFPIEVHSRRSEQQTPQQTSHPPSDDPLSLSGAATGDVVRGIGTAVQEVTGTKGEPHDAAQSDNQFNFISIDSGSLDNPTIVLEAGQVDADGNVVVYREPYGDQTLAYDPSMSYLAQLEASDLHQDDGSGDGEHMGIVIQSAGGGATRKRRVGRTRRRSSQEATDGDGMVLTCDLCDEVFNSADSLRTHKVCHASDKSFPCRFCQRVFSTNMALHYHWNEMHPLKLQPCPYCDKRFINKSNLNQHINTHQEPRFNCQIPQCNRQFHTRGDLRKHMVFKHSTEKNFSCPDCNLSFKVNWLLTRHRVRVHSQA